MPDGIDRGGTTGAEGEEERTSFEPDAKSDIYALGLIAFKLLTGRDPGTRSPSRIDGTLAPGWDDLVADALEAARGARLESAAMFAERLENMGVELSTGAGASASGARASARSSAVVEPAFTTGEQSSLTLDLGGGVELELAWLPPGSFEMGSPDSEEERASFEGPVHRVTFEHGFWMGRHAVTQRQYERVVGKNPSHFKKAGPDAPVEQVSWHEASEFCGKVEQTCGQQLPPGGYVRLPSEAEWEYACRAGTTTPFHYGSRLDSRMANFNGDYPYGNAPTGVFRQTTVQVGSFEPNARGLYDMHGNVWEWCEDFWHADYTGAPADGAPWTSGGDSARRVLRGGSWSFDARYCRSASRDWHGAAYRYNIRGFRMVVVGGMR
ncbi:MAG: SUMF1/EgtB/PvdO family nonheme iron enzyme [Kiritimatiellae bacterium]|nr:SUMF1/EgtB/PvdO family nonheme iron enzyme [Kiritimatiellia bacterium]